VYRHKWVQSLVELRRRLRKNPASPVRVEFVDFGELPKERGQFILSVKRIDGFTSVKRKGRTRSFAEPGLGLEAFGMRSRCGVLQSRAKAIEIASETYLGDDAGVLVIAVSDPTAAAAEASELTLRADVSPSYSQSDQAPLRNSYKTVFSSPALTLQELYAKQPILQFPVTETNKDLAENSTLEFEYELFFALERDPHLIYPPSMRLSVEEALKPICAARSSSFSSSRSSSSSSSSSSSASKCLEPAAVPPPPVRHRPVGFSQTGYNLQEVLDALLEAGADWLQAHPDFVARPFAIKHALTQRDGMYAATLFYHP